MRRLCLLFAQYGLLAASPVNEEYLFRSEGGTKGAVASEARECSYIGRDLLARGVSLQTTLYARFYLLTISGKCC